MAVTPILSTFEAVKKSPRTLLLLYVLLGYVFLQFSWWAYLIYDLNIELVNAKESIANLSGESYDRSADLSGKLLMIMGEGTVFLSLLLIGAFYIRKFLLREQRLAQQERNFVLATTHELNSPIAAVKLNLQTLQRREIEREKQLKLVDASLSANQRLENLVSNILMVSRLDSGRFELMQESLNLNEMLSQMIKRFAPLVKEAGSTIALECREDLTITTDRTSLDIIISNLIGNAIKYAPSAPIKVTAQREGQRLSINVMDEGKGIPTSEQANIFKKFYRVGSEETRSQKGTGLGLYLVKELAELNRMKLSVSDNQPHGCVFTLTTSNH